MNILSFDIEEWYLEKHFNGDRAAKYVQYDNKLHKILDELDKNNLKATFFCVGKMATEFPDVIRLITSKGHEIGCHSNEHTWLDKMDEATLKRDTQYAIRALEDVCGQKVKSYRAPAFSITENNKWAVSVLAECGIENDSSIFPAARDFGGYPSFPQDTPCKISYQSSELKEYPVCFSNVMGKSIAFSGGGYFRMLSNSTIKNMMNKRDYNIFYFHLKDVIDEKIGMLSKNQFEDYFKEPGTLKNRCVRYLKDNLRFGNVYDKLAGLMTNSSFISIATASECINWTEKETIIL